LSGDLTLIWLENIRQNHQVSIYSTFAYTKCNAERKRD